MPKPSKLPIHWRLRLSKFDFELRYKKRFKNCYADWLTQLRTSVEAQSLTTNLDVPLFESPEVDTTILVHSKIEANSQLIASQTTVNNGASYSQSTFPLWCKANFTRLFAIDLRTAEPETKTTILIMRGRTSSTYRTSETYYGEFQNHHNEALQKWRITNKLLENEEVERCFTTLDNISVGHPWALMHMTWY